jgi:hypothetical protein
MQRLISFGCSLTYGHGLPDCFIPPFDPGLNPSKLAWPSVVAAKLGKTCINMSDPGASNKRIWNSIINYKFKQDDIVFILWSYVDRSAIINRMQVKDIGTWINNDRSMAYYKHIHSDFDALLQTKLFVSHADFFLKEKGIKVYHLVAERNLAKIFKLGNITVSHVPLYIWNNYRCYHPTALDNSHPGIDCHIEFGEDVVKYITTGTVTHRSILEKIKCKLI